MAKEILKAKDAKRLSELRQKRGVGGFMTPEESAELVRLEEEARKAAEDRLSAAEEKEAKAEPAKEPAKEPPPWRS